MKIDWKGLEYNPTLGTVIGTVLGCLAAFVVGFYGIRLIDKFDKSVCELLCARAENRADCPAEKSPECLEDSAPPLAFADSLKEGQARRGYAVREDGALGVVAGDHAALNESFGKVYVVIGHALYGLAPVSDEEFKKFSATTVGIGFGIGSHGGNSTTNDLRKATAK